MMVLAMLRLGVSLADLEQLDFGMMMDMIITHNNLTIKSEDPDTIEASQDDYDAF